MFRYEHDSMYSILYNLKSSHDTLPETKIASENFWTWAIPREKFIVQPFVFMSSDSFREGISWLQCYMAYIYILYYIFTIQMYRNWLEDLSGARLREDLLETPMCKTVDGHIMYLELRYIQYVYMCTFTQSIWQSVICLCNLNTQPLCKDSSILKITI